MGSANKIGDSQLRLKGGTSQPLTSRLAAFDVNGQPVPTSPDSADASIPDWEGSLYVKKATLTQDGDLFYRANGSIVRLPIGTAAQVLTVGSNLLPGWAAATGGGGSIASEFYTTTNTAIPNNLLTKVPMNLTRFDATGLYDAANVRIKINVAGIYWVYGKLRHSTSTAIFPYLFVNGTQRSEGSASQNFPGGGIGIVGSLLQLSINDYVEIYGYQNSGGATAIDGSNTGYNYLDITKVA